MTSTIEESDARYVEHLITFGLINGCSNATLKKILVGGSLDAFIHSLTERVVDFVFTILILLPIGSGKNFIDL
jgi:hypothetical protein